MRNIVILLTAAVAIGVGCKKPLPEKPVQSQFGEPGEVGKLSEAVYKFQSCEHHLPQDWQEMVDKKYISKVPTAPAGKKYVWNDAGMVSVVAADAAPEK